MNSRSVKIYGHRKCLGTREVLREEDETQPNGRVFKKLICGKYYWQTYAEVGARSKNLGSGLAALGQQVRENILIFADTKAEWIIASQACFYYNYPGNNNHREGFFIFLIHALKKHLMIF